MYLRDRSETATNFRVLISPDTKYVEHRESLHELLSTVERGKKMQLRPDVQRRDDVGD